MAQPIFAELSIEALQDLHHELHCLSAAINLELTCRWTHQDQRADPDETRRLAQGLGETLTGLADGDTLPVVPLEALAPLSLVTKGIDHAAARA